MATYREAKCKLCRREGAKLFLKGDKCYMENVGFFAISKDTKEIYGIDAPMPLGSTEDYAYLVGNIFDSPELRQDAGQSAGQWADQPTLRPAT